MELNDIRLIAFYLPQFHPIPENDKWWGKGFTEWVNVVKARPFFHGHCQPFLPSDLGFYDLRVPESRLAQAELAKSFGIGGFCYWHYWFGNGKRLLERPFDEVLSSGKPDFPFCLAWANQTWSGIWHGAPDKVLVEQEYPGEKDWVDHFFTVLPAFNDKRYIRINGKPLFVIYKPSEMSDLASFVKCWQCLAHDNGLDAIYFIGITSVPLDKEETGLDGITSQPPGDLIGYKKTGVFDSLLKKFTDMTKEDLVRKYLNRPEVYDYEKITKIENYERLTLRANNTVYPCVMPNWDNTPRSGTNGIVLKNSTPEKFASNLKKAINFIETYESEEKIIFIKSWNEWAEGNVLEPSRLWGDAYLKVCKECLE